MKKLKLSFLQNELNRVSEWIRFSDKKSAFLSAYYSGIFLGIISYKDSVICSISKFQSWRLFFYIAVISIAAGLFILGMFFLISSVFPRLKNTNTDKSLFYFGNISKLKLIDYFNEMEKLTEDETKKQISEQIYTNSIIATQKMNYVKNSTKALFVLVIFVFILVLM
ncbi:MAG: hypothetical protein COX82_02420 [Candidatus Magasanikbacteria bacterium CG_4_10_14_0_2_um_filter_41_10]|uniref:Pycsar effector protein domain-containing protein n=1 Tax=Candidatus Magasanikbacteria bacterium CG_4_10_14_0_2_um_filter_41_10 TaxID=1974638 RepID=A0A2M7V506_9BACT|nr:MAG: hypothetical protein COX82_02420 [Candidatus Magasanikbacteria bacterium CG_4_10_14_0_2_um_filter_41_10]